MKMKIAISIITIKLVSKRVPKYMENILGLNPTEIISTFTLM